MKYCVMCANTELSLTARGNDWCHVTLITLSSLLAATILTIIGLTVALVRIKGKSSCTKGDQLLLLFH